MSAPVLLVGGDPVELAELRRCMVGLDVEVLTAASGNAALETVAERDLAFIIMGLDLPDLSGIEVTRLVHGDRSKQHIPVVLVTTTERSEAVMYRAYEAGVLDFITRPFKGGLILAKARLFLDLYQSRRRVERQKAELVRSNADFREFAHAAAHDLRAPLRAMGHYAARLQQDPDPAHRDVLAAQIRESLERMDGMLVGMLQYAELDRGSADIEPLDLTLVVTEALEALDPLREEFRGDVQVGPLPMLHGNGEQLRRLFQNIIGNALKYRRSGVPPEVRVTCEVEGAYACVRVADNGTGFDMAQVEDIFRPFKRLTRAAEGSGVGMATARKIAERHGGTLDATSEPGQGSVFRVRLPLQTAEITAFHGRRSVPPVPRELVASPAVGIAEPGPTGRPTSEAAPGLPCILVVDDSAADRDLAELALGGGYWIRQADSAERALYLMDGAVQVVVTDYNMPGRDGIWLLEQLAHRHPGVRRILVSGFPDDRCRDAYARGLAHALVEKPVSRADVDGLLAYPPRTG